MKLRAPCQIDLRTFPFDSQSCYLIIESYSYNNQRVKLAWLPSAPLTFMKNIELPDFVLTSWVTFEGTLEYPNGIWSQLNATFVFKRRYGFFVLQAYTPTYMTIFVSWISFCMDPRQISARATLGISAFLAMTFQFGTILKNQPPVSYIKSVDIWMLSGIMIMFATLAELAVISYMQRNCPAAGGSPLGSESPSDFAPRISALRYAMSAGDLPNCNHTTTDVMVTFGLRQKLTPTMVDRAAMIILPAIFFTFNICYWSYHLIFTG